MSKNEELEMIDDCKKKEKRKEKWMVWDRQTIENKSIRTASKTDFEKTGQWICVQFELVKYNKKNHVHAQ